MCYFIIESSRVKKNMKKKIFVTGGKHVSEVLTLLQAPSAFSVKRQNEKSPTLVNRAAGSSFNTC